MIWTPKSMMWVPKSIIWVAKAKMCVPKPTIWAMQIFYLVQILYIVQVCFRPWVLYVCNLNCKVRLVSRISAFV